MLAFRPPPYTQHEILLKGWKTVVVSGFLFYLKDGVSHARRTFQRTGALAL